MGSQAHALRRRKRLLKAQNVWRNNVPRAVRHKRVVSRKLLPFLIKEEKKLVGIKKGRAHTKVALQRRAG